MTLDEAYKLVAEVASPSDSEGLKKAMTLRRMSSSAPAMMTRSGWALPGAVWDSG